MYRKYSYMGGGNGGIIPLILNHGTTGKWKVVFPHKMWTRFQLHTKPTEPQAWYEHFSEQKSLSPAPGRNLLKLSPVVLRTTLFRLFGNNNEYIKYIVKYLLKTFTTKRVSAGRVAALIGSPGNTGLSSSNKTPLSAHSGVCCITGTTNKIQTNKEVNRNVCQ